MSKYNLIANRSKFATRQHTTWSQTASVRLRIYNHYNACSWKNQTYIDRIFLHFSYFRSFAVSGKWGFSGHSEIRDNHWWEACIITGKDFLNFHFPVLGTPLQFLVTLARHKSSTMRQNSPLVWFPVLHRQIEKLAMYQYPNWGFLTHPVREIWQFFEKRVYIVQKTNSSKWRCLLCLYMLLQMRSGCRKAKYTRRIWTGTELQRSERKIFTVPLQIVPHAWGSGASLYTVPAFSLWMVTVHRACMAI